MKNHKKHLLAVIIGTVSLSFARYALALEVSLPGLSENPSIGDYISALFKIAMAIAGGISLLGFTIGAVTLIISGNNPESASNAKDRMKGAVLGLVLTMASFIILNTINPSLVSPSLAALPGVDGIYLKKGDDKKPAPQFLVDASALSNKDSELNGYTELSYDCNNKDIAPALLVWKFPKPNFEGNDNNYGGVVVERKECGETTDVSTGSYKIAFETAGVYFYMGAGCDGYASQALTSSQDTIEAPFQKRMGSIKIVNDVKNNIYFGAIFHNAPGLDHGSLCTMPIVVDSSAGDCKDVSSDMTAAADIFRINNDGSSSGDGVNLYSEPYGWDTGARAGFFQIPDEKIDYRLDKKSDEMEYGYKNVDRTPAYQQACKTFQDCPGSILVKGDYVVGLYTSSTDGSDENPEETAPGDASLYCQTFIKDVPNLKAQDFIAAGGSKVGNVIIIATKK